MDLGIFSVGKKKFMTVSNDTGEKLPISYKLHLFGTVPGNLARVEESKALGWRFYAGETVGHRLL